jgi:hypothetical protein
LLGAQGRRKCVVAGVLRYRAAQILDRGGHIVEFLA